MDMEPISGRLFREALSHFASGVTVIAVRTSTGLIGFTATGFTSVSLSPPLVLVCVGRHASVHEGIVGAEIAEFWPDIAGHFIRKHQEKLARQAAQQGGSTTTTKAQPQGTVAPPADNTAPAPKPQDQKPQ